MPLKSVIYQMFEKKEKEPEKVALKLVNPIDYKLLFVIFGLAVAFQIFVTLAQGGMEADLTIAAVSFGFPLSGSIAAFVVARRYKSSKVFGRAYFALGLGMAMNFLGEVSYYILETMDLVTYPSISDVFYLAFYPLAFYHLAKNIQFFKPKVKIGIKILIVTIPVALIGTYSVLSYGLIGEMNSDYFYGLSYVVGSSVLLSGAIFGAMIFRQGVLGTAWLVLVIGMALLTLGDSWYAYLGTFSEYSSTHLVNLLWYAGYMVIAYALYKHQDTI